MSPVHLRKLTIPRNEPEDREGLSRTRIPGRGHLEHSGGWQNTEGNYTHTAIHIPIQQKPQTRGLERYGSSSSSPPTPQRFISMEHGQKEAVETPGVEGKQDKGESSHYPSYRRTTDPDRAHSDSIRLTSRRPNRLSSGFIPFRKQQISGQESPFFTLPRGFQEKTRTQRQKQDLSSPKSERVRPNYPETAVIGERNTQEQDVVENNSRISSPLNGNINPT
ncbi:hypothetical protein O181_034081 [Austropuccinia psidii MF-1]|uniref:Uncharacterized protein n=1 Tax=Austropuccinia psidii MF-1 TaxID=1389203 RepID=A0A9Q3H7P0_9BASI|nr:hypothetical protein [Austropuccinia psidii MF-1]